MVASNLPPAAQAWGRDIEKRLRTLETIAVRSEASLKSNSTGMSALQNTVRDINVAGEVTKINSSTRVFRTGAVSMVGSHVLPVEISIDPEWRGAVEFFVVPESYTELSGTIKGDYELRFKGLDGFNVTEVYLGGKAPFEGKLSSSSFQTVSGILRLGNWWFGDENRPASTIEISCNVTSQTPVAEIAFNVYMTPRLSSIGE